ncbi:MAG: Ig domain-containing protein [Bacteroidales bacterium]|nr:Ig domain-containing protein [Bacteroidales bacterium]
MKRILFAIAALLTLASSCTQEVDPTSVRLDQHELTLAEGETASLTATIAPSNATNTAVNWSSSKPSVADVDKNGKVTALTEGQASISVSTLAGGLTDACIVTVTKKPVPVTGVKLDRTSYEMTEGDTYQLTATVEPANASNQSVTFTSSNDEVASVDNLGYVRAHSEGTATITVKTEDGGFTAKCEVTVLKYTIPVVGVWVQPNELTLQKGETATLQWYVDPESATDRSVKFASSDTKVATVSDEGVVTAVDYGEATVTISTVDGGFTDECKVTVAAVVEGVTITPASVEIAEGKTAQLSASVSPAGASQEVEWASFDNNIAKVDASGLVTAVAAGTTRISARSKEYPDKQGFCEVTVTQDNTLKGISLNPTELTLKVGEAYTLTVLYTPDHAVNKKVGWTSSNGDVATVTSEGKVVALAEGTATITATSEEGGFTASCAVTVSKEAGARVYYTVDSTTDLYVNGVPDPLSGAFDRETDSFISSFNYVKGICSDGSDLYSLERYSDIVLNEGSYVSGGDVLYLCKNRKPVCKVDAHSAYDLIGMSSCNGYVGIVLWEGEDSFYIVRINHDGTSSRKYITGRAVSFSWTKMFCAMAPDGTFDIVDVIWDSFGSRYMAIYEYANDGTLTETLIKPDFNGFSAIGISDEGDRYILSGNGTDVELLKNEEVVYNTTVNGNERYGLHATGGHVYTAVQCETGGRLTMEEACDGKPVRTLNLNDICIKNPLIVSSSGDMYVATENHIYKNEKTLFTITDTWLTGFAVVE